MNTVCKTPVLPAGVELWPLVLHRDKRGTFAEIFRDEWHTGVRPVQWSVSLSEQGVLRGVHVHLRHEDYVTIARGRASVGLRDLRPGSPTEGHTALFEVCGDELAGLIIPRGVAHGFYFHEPSLYLLATSACWDGSDELGCHWADPALGIAWPVTSACLSDGDEALPPLTTIASLIPPWRTG